MKLNGTFFLEAIAIFANILMAGFTAWMAYSTNRMAKATRDSIRTEQIAIEQGKDALMPVMAIEWAIQYVKAGTPSAQKFRLTLQNYGTGPAFIHEVTTRNEVGLGTLYHSSVRTAILKPEERYTVELMGTPTIIVGNCAQISSLSIWYTDVYDRWFRSRIIFKYPERKYTEFDQWVDVEVLAREYKKVTLTPSFTWGEINNFYPPNYVGRFEGGRFIPAGMLPPEWYSLKTRTVVKGLEISAIAETNNRPVSLIDMSYWSMDSRPAFTLQMEGYPPFVLGLQSNGDNNHPVPYVIAIEEYESKKFGMAPPFTNVDQVALESWGLTDKNAARDKMSTLYRHVFRQVKASIESLDESNRTGPILPA